MACLALIGLLACGGGGKSDGRREIVVYAAASTTDLLTEAADSFTTQSGVEVGFEFASSGSLARKIEAGSPTDIFVSANEHWIEYAAEQGLLENGRSVMFACNTLVFVEPAELPSGLTSPADLAGAERISMGDPEHVPAGRYAKEALEHYGLWEGLTVGEKLVLTFNVSTALSYVEQGGVTGGIVYSTDAIRSEKVTTAFTFPDESHKPVTYHAGLVSNTESRQDALAFLQFLGSAQFYGILEKHGFRQP